MTTLIEEANEIVQTSGGRMTSQRRLILETLDSMSGHPSAEEIFQNARLEDSTLNLSTVYRTLRWLEKMELIRPHHFHDGSHQDRFDSTNDVEHSHFHCSSCGRVIEFTSPAVDWIKKDYAMLNHCQVDEASLVLYGTCHECLAEMKG